MNRGMGLLVYRRVHNPIFFKRYKSLLSKQIRTECGRVTAAFGRNCGKIEIFVF